MKVDFELYRKSKPFIQDRTKDYESYLARKILTNNRAEMLKLEIEELDVQREALMKEYDQEVGIQSELFDDEDMDKISLALNTIEKIINNEGTIGLDRIEEIATIQDVSVAELKRRIPIKYRDKVLAHHFVVVEGRTNYELLQ